MFKILETCESEISVLIESRIESAATIRQFNDLLVGWQLGVIFVNCG